MNGSELQTEKSDRKQQTDIYQLLVKRQRPQTHTGPSCPEPASGQTPPTLNPLTERMNRAAALCDDDEMKTCDNTE